MARLDSDRAAECTKIGSRHDEGIAPYQVILSRVAALVLLMRHHIGRNAAPKPTPGAAARGRF